jgi:high affinity Mn2+ porin
MTHHHTLLLAAAAFAAAAIGASPAFAQSADSSEKTIPLSAQMASPVQPGKDTPAEPQEQRWSLHVQNTEVVQGDAGFPAKYSGPDSLNSAGETKESVSLDLMVGVRLWSGAEFHADGIMWQGFGLSNAVGAAGFPNGEAFRLGTKAPNENLCRVFIRQTIGLGGEQEPAPDDPLHLAGKQDISRITLTIGRMSAKDIFDNNAYANDPRTQFLNWSLLANGAWDFPADSLGFISGLVIELNQPVWTLRYGMFQVPRVENGVALDPHYLEAWSMVTEGERRFSIYDHPGVIRLLGFLSQSHQGSFEDALDSPVRPADAVESTTYRKKFGFGINLEQEIAKDVGVFARLGWNDGKTEAWCFTDVNRTASLGVSVKGSRWGRPDDTFGLAGVINALSSSAARFFAAGGTGILVGDGTLTYGTERILEAYYDAKIWKSVHLAFDYQFITNPAYNQDRGPVSVFGGRLHWEF